MAHLDYTCEGLGVQTNLGGAVKCRGKGRKTWGEYMRKGVELWGMKPEWSIFREV